MALYCEFTIQLKRFLRTCKTSTSLGAVYDYAFGDAVDSDWLYTSTESMRPSQQLPPQYRMRFIRHKSFKFYEVPVENFAEAALLAEWKRCIRLKDDDDVCGAYSVRMVHLSSDNDI